MKRLDEMLNEYSTKDYYAFHMPGHKRHMEPAPFSNPFSVDITEIEGFDNLHHPNGVIREAQDRAARLYGAQRTYYCVNGSSGGILSAISACTSRGGTLVMARNSHKAVYHSAYVRDLKTAYLNPERETRFGLNGGIVPEEVQRVLEQTPGAQAVILTSPTYDGMVSDIREIARTVHGYGIPLIVDEAHGAHLGFHPYFPQGALACGADLVIQSLHKTMPCLTQTALVHVGTGRICLEKLERFLGIYQTTSPSYMLMGSMDYGLGYVEERKPVMFEQYSIRLKACRQRLGKLKRLRLVPVEIQGSSGIYAADPSKLVISTGSSGLTGNELYTILLEKYHLQMEMAARDYVLGMTSVMDTTEGYERLCTALEEIDQNVDNSREQQAPCGYNGYWTYGIQRASIATALEGSKVSIPFEKSPGRISGEYIYLYPPGIPLLVPGEEITEELVQEIRAYRRQGLEVQGTIDGEGNWIQVVEEEPSGI